MSKVIVIDCGHGGNGSTAGKRSSVKQVGRMVYEWDMNNAVGLKIQALLKNYDVIVYRTDDTSGKTDVSLSARVSKTNSINPDVFVSIHHNAGGGTGVETYWHTQGSAKDKQLATVIQTKMASKTGMKNRGVKQMALAVLTCKSTIPAVLVEGGFYDTKSDFDYLMSSAGQQAYAEAVVEGIAEFLGIKKVSSTTTTSTTTTTQTKKNTTKVETVKGEWKIKVLQDTNLWNDTSYKTVGGHVKKDQVLYVTEITKDYNFFVYQGKYLVNSSTYNYVTNMWDKPLGKIMLKQDCNAWSYANFNKVAGRLNAWDIKEYTSYKDGFYHVPYIGYVHESMVNKTLKLTDALVTN